jgi:polyphosphate kinase 2 (PPK2 family)
VLGVGSVLAGPLRSTALNETVRMAKLLLLALVILNEVLRKRPEQGQMDVLLVAAKKEEINEAAQIARDAKLKPLVIDVDMPHHPAGREQQPAHLHRAARAVRRRARRGGRGVHDRDVPVPLVEHRLGCDLTDPLVVRIDRIAETSRRPAEQPDERRLAKRRADPRHDIPHDISLQRRLGDDAVEPDTAERFRGLRRVGYVHEDRMRSRLGERIRQATHRPHAPWHMVSAADPRARNLAVADLLLARFRSHLRVRRRIAAPAKPAPAVPLRPAGLRRLRALVLDQPLSEEAYEAKRDKWLGRLNRAVRDAAALGRSIVWVFEGWDAAGKGGAIRRLTGAIDARDYRVIPVAKPTDEEKSHHYLWRFWRNIPRAGRVTIYDRSWYGRVLVERLEGFCTSAEWRRAYAELNDFEAQLADHGIIVLKFWLHLSPAEQLRRFRHREDTPYKRHKINAEDWRNRRKWAGYEIAVGDMLALTDRPAAPWHLIPADNKRFARLEILKASCKRIAEVLEE